MLTGVTKKPKRPSVRQPETPDIRNNRDLKTSSASMSKVLSAVEKLVRLNEARYGSKPTVTNIRQRMVKSSLISLIQVIYSKAPPYI